MTEQEPLNIFDFERLAQSRRGRDVHDYYAGGAFDEVALRASRDAYGRPVLWGLAADGARGVSRVIEMLQREIDSSMGLCGCPTVDRITADLLRPDSTSSG